MRWQILFPLSLSFSHPNIYTHTAGLLLGTFIRVRARQCTEAVPFNAERHNVRLQILRRVIQRAG